MRIWGMAYLRGGTFGGQSIPSQFESWKFNWGIITMQRNKMPWRTFRGSSGGTNQCVACEWKINTPGSLFIVFGQNRDLRGTICYLEATRWYTSGVLKRKEGFANKEAAETRKVHLRQMEHQVKFQKLQRVSKWFQVGYIIWSPRCLWVTGVMMSISEWRQWSLNKVNNLPRVTHLAAQIGN